MFERAVAYAAADPGAAPLWEAFISHARVTGPVTRVAALYARAVRCPLEGLEALETGCAPLSVCLPFRSASDACHSAPL